MKHFKVPVPEGYEIDQEKAHSQRLYLNLLNPNLLKQTK